MNNSLLITELDCLNKLYIAPYSQCDNAVSKNVVSKNVVSKNVVSKNVVSKNVVALYVAHASPLT